MNALNVEVHPDHIEFTIYDGHKITTRFSLKGLTVGRVVVASNTDTVAKSVIAASPHSPEPLDHIRSLKAHRNEP